MVEKKQKQPFYTTKKFYLFSIIFLLAAFLRFYNYGNRWGLASDQARDVLVVREALRTHQLPLIGPFSASGPFVFGPLWYWIFMIPIGLFPHSLIAPWIFQSLLYLLTIPLSYAIGKELVDENFALLFALFSAISTFRVRISSNLIVSALAGFISIVIFYLFVKYLKSKKPLYLFLYAFLLGVAINVHFEMVPLALLLPIGLFIERKNIVRCLAAILLFIIPFAPLIIFNYQTHNYEIANIFRLHSDTNKVKPLGYLKEKALLLIDFFPRMFGDVIGGSIWAGYIIVFSLIVGFFLMLTKKVNREMKMLGCIFAALSVLVLLYEGRLFENFLGFLFTFELIFVSYLCYVVCKYNSKIGFVLVTLIVVFSLISDANLIGNATNNAIVNARSWEHQLTSKYPKTKFAVYNYSNINTDKSIPLSLVLDVDGFSGDSQFKIGLGYLGAPIDRQVIFSGPEQLRIYDLRGASDQQLKKENFSPVNPSKIYASVEDWYK